MDDNKKISISIAGRHYPVVVNSSEEALLRELEATIKFKLVDLSSNYPKLDTQDYLALILMEIATKPLQQKNTDELEKIIQTVKSHLRQ